ncbi:hypothetical protein AK812_SmicGene13841 [Symbiodinium microadriaticum]|uniref:Uncharacterized protein n=1 Tax=Symbiodinium microadriaticum TaxID=2951 RepID=A0A1Q9E731_SYMMI|nr:hypothetical protein AK812_SmicGene13841 [Symbiodinium microadriaticum]CAE7310075.1 unnamed protein product [Symbiodinium microadriaticum]CAE7738739.1 unnamed protein product [Symbiodinium sp. KB8]
MVCSCWSTIAHQAAEAARSKQCKQAERQAMIDEQLVAAEAKAMQDRSSRKDHFNALYEMTSSDSSFQIATKRGKGAGANRNPRDIDVATKDALSELDVRAAIVCMPPGRQGPEGWSTDELKQLPKVVSRDVPVKKFGLTSHGELKTRLSWRDYDSHKGYFEHGRSWLIGSNESNASPTSWLVVRTLLIFMGCRLVFQADAAKRQYMAMLAEPDTHIDVEATLSFKRNLPPNEQDKACWNPCFPDLVDGNSANKADVKS